MTIDEAIKMLDKIAAQDEESGRPECVEAEKLGIEALKAIQRLHRDGHISKLWQLPGETKD